MADKQKDKTERNRGLYNRWNFEIAKFASKEASRYTLQAILIEPGATVVTDGHRLVKVDAPNMDTDSFSTVPGHPHEPVTANFLFPAKAALEVAKKIPRKQPAPVLQTAAKLQTDSEHVGFVSTDLETASPAITRKMEGQFPKYEVAFPKEEDKVFGITLDGRLLAELAKFMADFHGEVSGRYPIRLTFYKEGKPVKLEATNIETDQKAVAILMPMRD